jgi:hypothetical protein
VVTPLTIVRLLISARFIWIRTNGCRKAAVHTQSAFSKGQTSIYKTIPPPMLTIVNAASALAAWVVAGATAGAATSLKSHELFFQVKFFCPT